LLSTVTLANESPSKFVTLTGGVVGDYFIFGDDPSKDRSIWRFQFTTMHTYPSNILFEIEFPSSFKDILTPYTVSSVNGFTLLSGSPTFSNSKFSFISTDVSSKTLSFQIENVMNPTSNSIKKK
jgi:hypothetical protein